MKTNLTDNAYETFRDFIWLLTYRGFSPVSDGKESTQKKPKKNPPAMPETWEDPGRREELLTAVFWPGEFHRGRLGYSPWGRRVRHDWVTFTFSDLYTDIWFVAPMKSWVPTGNICFLKYFLNLFVYFWLHRAFIASRAFL